MSAKVIIGGEVKGKKGSQLARNETVYQFSYGKRQKDLEFGIKNKVDFVAFSFVRLPMMCRTPGYFRQSQIKAKIIAKIEEVEGLENIDKIIELVDGIMIMRRFWH